MTIGTDQGLVHLLSQVQSLATRRLTGALAERGCSLEEWWVLDALSAGGGRPMNEIAEYAMLPKPSLTKLVDAMVAGNLVFRRGDAEDRRRVLLFLTARGKKRLVELRAVVDAEEAVLGSAVGGHLAGLRSALENAVATLR